MSLPENIIVHQQYRLLIGLFKFDAAPYTRVNCSDLNSMGIMDGLIISLVSQVIGDASCTYTFNIHLLVSHLQHYIL